MLILLLVIYLFNQEDIYYQIEGKTYSVCVLFSGKFQVLALVVSVALAGSGHLQSLLLLRV